MVITGDRGGLLTELGCVAKTGVEVIRRARDDSGGEVGGLTDLGGLSVEFILNTLALTSGDGGGLLGRLRETCVVGKADVEVIRLTSCAGGGLLVRNTLALTSGDNGGLLGRLWETCVVGKAGVEVIRPTSCAGGGLLVRNTLALTSGDGGGLLGRLWETCVVGKAGVEAIRNTSRAG